jgi:hypothetical protein
VQLESYPNDFVNTSEIRPRPDDGQLWPYELTEREIDERMAAITRRFEDPWLLLQDFTAVKTVDELLRFLNATGHFCDPYADPNVGMYEQPEWLFNAGDLRYPITDFWEVQELLAQMLLSGQPLVGLDPDALPPAWLAVFDQGYNFRIKKSLGEYVAEVTTNDTLPTLIAIAQLKIMRGGKFRICKRPDCGRVFEFETRGRRENRYCGHLCAHTAWQRRARKTKVEIRDERKQFGYGHYKKSR